jgi:hypothetical protein
VRCRSTRLHTVRADTLSGDRFKFVQFLVTFTMCHGHVPRDWSEDEQTSADDSDPAFLNEESSVESELVTDGGDEEDDE